MKTFITNDLIYYFETRGYTKKFARILKFLHENTDPLVEMVVRNQTEDKFTNDDFWYWEDVDHKVVLIIRLCRIYLYYIKDDNGKLTFKVRKGKQL